MTKRFATVLLGFALLAPAAQAELLSLTVPGTANPYLADPANRPNPSDDRFDGTAPPSIGVAGVASLTVAATGRTSLGGPNFSPTPDGNLNNFATTPFGPQGGISSWRLPINSLVGVFLGEVVGPPPPPFPSVVDFLSASPRLGQVFFIGDGLTGTGTGQVQTFFVPAGATRLYFADLDGFRWRDNLGEFAVDVTTQPIPEPSALVLSGLGALGLIGYGWRCRQVGGLAGEVARPVRGRQRTG